MKFRHSVARFLLVALASLSTISSGESFETLDARLDDLLAELDPDLSFANSDGIEFAGIRLRIEQCGNYPYNQPDPSAERQLAQDLSAGLRKGIACLAGHGPAGRLHPYHEYQAHRLLSILESGETKAFRCVADRIFANAVATSKTLNPGNDVLSGVLRETAHPGVVLDTFRIGGLLSTRHSRDTYRNFFNLDEQQIREHLTGSPLRLGGNHRYRDLPALLFHEMVHWLGHQHSAIYPDVAHLYETCCFGGSDYIEDTDANARFQARACAALQDDDLWSTAYSPYRQMRFWHFKGYNRLKSAMRENYR